MDRRLYGESLAILHRFYGSDAVFRPGQYEAVEAVMHHRRVLVIQRTGWGKSLVYFLCARLLSRQTQGVTVVVSPLLALMQDQFDSARALGLSCAMLCSTTRHLRPQILADAALGRYELLFITPETLFSAGVQATLSSLRVSLLVLDEAHCISDWGHDFRPDYGRLVQILQRLPHPPHILATTATADVQVIRDLRGQFGGFHKVLRGPLKRPGLSIQVIPLPSRVMRCAWILDNLPSLPGTGLIYCLSRQDCDQVAAFLRSYGVDALAYHSQVEDPAAVEQAFRENRVRILVATIKLGLGYNKSDIDFVIHFQSPGSLSAYYQQIGRAGRGTEAARTFLLCGAEDAQIHRLFREQAFPTSSELEKLHTLIRKHPGDSREELARHMNVSPDAILRPLRFLSFGGTVSEDGGRYQPLRRSLRSYLRHIDTVRRYREHCWDDMQDFIRTEGCLEQSLIRALGDTRAMPCGICANCAPSQALPAAVSPAAHQKALSYFSPLPSPLTLSGAPELLPGLALSLRGQPGYALLAEHALTVSDEPLPEALILGAAVALQGLLARQRITAVTAIPGDSEAFAQRLAEACAIAYVPLPESPADIPADLPRRLLLVDALCRTDTALCRAAGTLFAAGAEAVMPFTLCDLRTGR